MSRNRGQAKLGTSNKEIWTETGKLFSGQPGSKAADFSTGAPSNIMRAPVTIDTLRGKYGSVRGADDKDGGELGHYAESAEENMVTCWQASFPLAF